MQTGLHALTWGFQRLAAVVVLGAFAVMLAYALLIFVIVLVQGAVAFGQ